MFMVRLVRRRKKHLPGRTTEQQKLRSPMMDCNFLSVIFLHFDISFSCDLTFVSLSSGSLASMDSESSSKPIKVKRVVGRTVFSCLIGTPMYSHSVRKFERSIAQNSVL